MVLEAKVQKRNVILWCWRTRSRRRRGKRIRRRRGRRTRRIKEEDRDKSLNNGVKISKGFTELISPLTISCCVHSFKQ
jgi:hypothetical protein